ncbi:unnamed protein product, partial [Ectocarpus sp. 13 AM-2016]
PGCEALWCRGGYSRNSFDTTMHILRTRILKTSPFISLQHFIQGYDPRRTGIGSGVDQALTDFTNVVLTGRLTEVPGIGPRFSGLLGEGEGEDCIKNTFQLIGKFLVLRTSNEEDGKLIDCVEHCDKFYWWLQSKGIGGGRGRIVQCIAEKVNMSYPGIYDSRAWTDP